jgi:hypothetical protein
MSDSLDETQNIHGENAPAERNHTFARGPEEADVRQGELVGQTSAEEFLLEADSILASQVEGEKIEEGLRYDPRIGLFEGFEAFFTGTDPHLVPTIEELCVLRGTTYEQAVTHFGTNILGIFQRYLDVAAEREPMVAKGLPDNLAGYQDALRDLSRDRLVLDFVKQFNIPQSIPLSRFQYFVEEKMLTSPLGVDEYFNSVRQLGLDYAIETLGPNTARYLTALSRAYNAILSKDPKTVSEEELALLKSINARGHRVIEMVMKEPDITPGRLGRDHDQA